MTPLPLHEGELLMKDYTRHFPFIGRVLIGGTFILTGLEKLGSYTATTQMIGAVGLPFAPLGWLIAVFVELGCGFLVLIGLRTRPAAFILAGWALVTASLFHTDLADANQLINLLKNLVIAGGLLQIAHFGGGATSVDARKNRSIRAGEGSARTLEG
jgi:putative oxidoreductase